MKRTVTDEAFFTTPELAERCVQVTRRHVDLDACGLVVEPSAGRGVFLDGLPRDRTVAIDLHPRHPDVVAGDFLDWTPPSVDGPVLTIGNPPFGQRAALAVRFVAHACSFSDTVAFILPRSFNKFTFQMRVPARFHLVDGFDCDAFTDVDGAPRPVRATFQVWQRRDHDRDTSRPPDRHPDFVMTHRHLSRTPPDDLARIRATHPFAVPQVGGRFTPRDATEVTRGSHWFIRPNVDGVRERFERLDFAFLEGMNTAHTSLSKRDIVRAYTEVLDREGADRTAHPVEAHDSTARDRRVAASD